MVDELIDIFDENNNPLGIKKMRSEAHLKGLWHRATHMWLYNSKGEVILQQRAKEKIFYPNRWDASAAGHVPSGEEPLDAAQRELEEELGLKVNKKDLQFYGVKKYEDQFKNLKNNEFCYVYFIKFDGDIKKLKIQKEELQKVEFFSLEKLKQQTKSNPDMFIPNGEYWFEVFNEAKKRAAIIY